MAAAARGMGVGVFMSIQRGAFGSNPSIHIAQYPDEYRMVRHKT